MSEQSESPNGEVTVVKSEEPDSRTRSLEQTLEEIRERVEAALTGPEAQALQRWMRERADDVERAIEGPRGQEVRATLERSLNDVARRLEAVLAGPPGRTRQERVSALMEEMGDTVERALKSPTAAEVRGTLARFLDDLARRIAPAERKESPPDED